MHKRALLFLSLLVVCWLPLAWAEAPPQGRLTLDAAVATGLPRDFRTAASPFVPAEGPARDSERNGGTP